MAEGFYEGGPWRDYQDELLSLVSGPIELGWIHPIIMSTNNPVQAGIIPGADDSEFPHVHAKCDPAEQIHEIRTFYDTVQFDRIGVIYDYATADRRIYAAFPDLELVAGEKDFAIVVCDAPEYDLGPDQIAAGVYVCLETPAPQIDAFYITDHNRFTTDTLPGILEPLFTSKQGGLGLGLAIKKSLIETNGGSAAARSIVAGGSVFVITLPVSEAS